MTASKPTVLTFDVVGTLIDFEAGMLGYLRKACGETIAKLEDDTILAAYRTARAAKDSLRFPDDLTRVYGIIAPQLGLPQDADIAKDFPASVLNWPAFPDSVEALRRLKRHFKLVAMTNAQRWALDGMARTLGEPFDDSVTVDEALCEKPDPCFFAFARGRLSRDGHGMHDILHVAQSQYHDIGVARRMGYTVAWIERRHAQKGTGGTLETPVTTPHYHFRSLAELADKADAGALTMFP